jgi:hypothetical protein
VGTRVNFFGYFLNIEGDFGDENGIGRTGYTGVERDPTCIAPNDLNE